MSNGGVLTAYHSEHELSLGQYLLVFALMCVGMAFFAAIGLLADSIFLAAIGAAFIMLPVIFVRVEMGLFLLALLIPFEWSLQISEQITVLRVLGIVVGAVGVLRVIVQKPQPWPLSLKILLALVVWAGVCSTWNVTRMGFERTFIRGGYSTLVSNAIMVYLIVRYCSTPNAMKALLIVAIVGSAAAAAKSLTIGTEMSGDVMEARVETYKANINTFARFMFPGIFFSIALFWELRWTVAKVLLVLAGLVCSAGLLFTVARGATGGAAVGIVVTILTFTKVPIRKRLLLVGALIVLVAAGLAFTAYAGADEAWAERMDDPIGGQSGLVQRIRLWRAAFGVGMQNPLLGVGSVNEVEAFYRAGIRQTESHNDFLSMFVQNGIFGLVLFVLLWGMIFWRLWKMPHGSLRSAMLGAATAFMLTGMFNPSLIKKVFWLNVGVFVACAVFSRQHEQALAEGDQ